MWAGVDRLQARTVQKNLVLISQVTRTRQANSLGDREDAAFLDLDMEVTVLVFVRKTFLKSQVEGTRLRGVSLKGLRQAGRKRTCLTIISKCNLRQGVAKCLLNTLHPSNKLTGMVSNSFV